MFHFASDDYSESRYDETDDLAVFDDLVDLLEVRIRIDMPPFRDFRAVEMLL